MPITSFYKSYNATKQNLGLTDDAEPVIGLYEGYDAVYPFLTANVTTPYTISLVDLSATGPLVLNIPEGSVFGVANNAWQEPIQEFDANPRKHLYKLWTRMAAGSYFPPPVKEVEIPKKDGSIRKLGIPMGKS
jgi:hypothetical protein